MKILAGCRVNLLDLEYEGEIGSLWRGLLDLAGNQVIGMDSTMTSFTIELPDELVRRLRELAQKLGATPEEALCAGVHEWLTSSSTDFNQAAFYVLKKNAELYRRLS